MVQLGLRGLTLTKPNQNPITYHYVGNEVSVYIFATSHHISKGPLTEYDDDDQGEVGVGHHRDQQLRQHDQESLREELEYLRDPVVHCRLNHSVTIST